MSVIDQIDKSLEKASKLQKKRLQSEESRKEQLNYDIGELKKHLQESQYSPLREEINQLELQDQMLLDHSDDEDLEPVYQIPKTSQRQFTNKTLQIQQLDKKKDKKQNSIPKKAPMKQRISLKLTKEEEIENEIPINELKDPNYLNKVITKVKQQVSKSLKKNIPPQSTTPKLSQQQSYKVRGLRDQAEIKYFGRPLPCKECVYLLSKGMSSDYCSQHGQAYKEKPPQQQVPKRFSKYY
ncbi:hypothetical protein pb186bvf_018202 [Paramecium bursaria]